MSALKTLLKQSSHYFGARLFLMAAGLISFPIFTRIFSVADYGMLGLVTTTISFVVAITKLGFPNAIVRFYAECKAESRLTDFYSTIFSSSLVASTTVMLLFVTVLQLLPERIISHRLSMLFSLAAILIFTKCTCGILTSFIRAEQKTKLYNIIAIVNRYGSLACSIFFAFFIIKGLYGLFVGRIIVSIITMLFLLILYRERIKLGLQYFFPNELKRALKFGFPLLWAELGHLILSYGDRYLIQFYLGSSALGLYTAGYNLTTYLTQALIYPINYAMTPIYMNIFVNQGEQQTKEFLTKLFTYFLLLMIPAVFGFIAVGKDLISFLASAKYSEVYLILPYIILGQAIYACTIILNTGLFVSKKTFVVTYVILGTSVLNLVLNSIFIPKYGILGAAQATLISYLFYAVILTYFSMREFSFNIEYRRISSFIIASGSMFFIIIHINFPGSLMTLLAKIFAGALIYVFLVILLDREIRHKSVLLWERLRLKVMPGC